MQRLINIFKTTCDFFFIGIQIKIMKNNQIKNN